MDNRGSFRFRQGGAVKFDCERNAAKRLCRALGERDPDLKPIPVEDALYANAPHLRQITENGRLAGSNVKPDSHQSLERQFAGRKERGPFKVNFSHDGCVRQANG